VSSRDVTRAAEPSSSRFRLVARVRLVAGTLAVLFAGEAVSQEKAEPQTPAPQSATVHLIAVNPPEVPAPLPLDPDSIAPSGAAPKAKPPGKERSTEFIAAPIPMSNPTIGTGLGVVAALLFPLKKSDTISPPAVLGVGGFYTDSRSYTVGAAMKAYMAEDHWRLLAGAATGQIHYDLFLSGIGPGSSPPSIPISQDVSGLQAEVLRRVSSTLFVGARYNYANTTLRINPADADSPAAPPQQDFSVTTASLGPRLQSDSRDSTFYPLQGALFDLRADFYEPAFGGNRTFQSYKASLEAFFSQGDRGVLAGRLSACNVRGDAPVYALCLFGLQGDLRGYSVGRYLDRTMFAAQAEYRLRLPEDLGFFGKFGFVAFAGVGEVAPTFGDMNSENLLPSGGIGIRFLLARENHINFRIDYAWGKSGSKGLYVGVGEAF
jgi:Omp85 superfamily domain